MHPDHKNTWGRLFSFCSVALFSLVSLYPLVWMLFQSLKSDFEFFSNQYAPPLAPLWVNYAVAWEKANFSQYYLNSVFTTGVSLTIGIFVCLLAGYAFSKLEFFGKKILYGVLVAVLFLPAPLLIFPNYFLARDLGILGTHAGLIGPYVAGLIPLSMMILINSYNSIPKEMSESAQMDGCNDYRIWWSIMVPLVAPAVATVAILGFLSVWNEYIWALVSLNSKVMFTLPVGVVDIGSKVQIYGYGPVFAGMTMTTLPIIIFYIALQGQFVKSITAGAVKG
jgi:ABC-type glycerol-3-phosphate transport system permease component